MPNAYLKGEELDLNTFDDWCFTCMAGNINTINDNRLYFDYEGIIDD